MGDGWYANVPLSVAKPFIEKMRASAATAGRDPGRIGVQVCLLAGKKPPEERARETASWLDTGVTHFDYNTMNAGFTHLDQHVDALRRFKEALPDHIVKSR